MPPALVMEFFLKKIEVIKEETETAKESKHGPFRKETKH